MTELRVVTNHAVTRKGRRYTKAEEAVAVGVAVTKGLRAASEATGIPLSTLHGWYHRPEFAQMRTTAREEVAESMWAGAQLGVAAMVAALDDPKVPLRDKTDATSMLFEKFLLVTGHATSRTEHRDITDTLSPDAVEALTDDIDEWLKARK